jgi:hypothetical protein
MEIAHNTQEKFDFYLLALVFTLLALSVQSAKFEGGALSTSFELLGWMFLLASGLFGLWRIEYIPVERVKLAQLDGLNEKINEAKRLKLSGTSEIHVLSTDDKQSLEDRISNLKESVELLTPLTKELEKENLIKYKVHKLGFVLGLTLVVVARGIEPLIVVLSSIAKCT